MATVDPARAPQRAGVARGKLWPRLVDRFFSSASLGFGLLILVLIVWIGYRLYRDSALTRHAFGLGILTETTWDVPHHIYGAATFIFGTLISSLVAMVVAVPVGIGAALFLTEVAPKWLATPISFMVELLAAVPSIVYGLWGFTVLCPWLQARVSPGLHESLGANPLFAGTPVLTNVLAAGLILAIMIVPFITAVSREVIRTVPTNLREASTGLGSTRWETIKNVVLPSSKVGISGACILGLGRAIGETMAVIMVIGNTPQIKASLLQPAYTMSGLIANQFNEAYIDKMQMSALLEIALILFAITLIVNVGARLLILFAKGRYGRGAPDDSGWGRVKRGLSFGAEFVGANAFRVLLLGLVALQVGCDLRAYGPTALLRPFEILCASLGAIYLGFRVAASRTTRLRHTLDGVMRGVFGLCGFLAVFVLGAVLWYVASQGYPGLNLQLFTEPPHPVGVPGGGLENAILGTIELVLIAGAVGIPIGLLAGVYVAEFSTGRLGPIVRFAADVLNGIPSVVIGLFAYAAFVLPFGHFSAWAGGLALAVILIPTVARTTEDMLRLTPNSYREAALGLGATKAQMIRTVIIPAARAGVVTGVMLGIARIAGETAPLLFTAFGSEVMDMRPSQPVSSLTLKIYVYAISPYKDWIQQAWAGALVLLLFVLILSLAARIAISRSAVRRFG